MNTQQPGDEKITNQDEQEIAVNKSTSPDGYDQPVNRMADDERETSDIKSKRNDTSEHPGKRKKPGEKAKSYTKENGEG